MNGLRIVCGNCRRHWSYNVADSIYLQMEIASRPCPTCGAQVLTCQKADPARTPRLRTGDLGVVPLDEGSARNTGRRGEARAGTRAG